MDLPPNYLETLERRRYSKGTVKTYCSYFADYQRHFQNRKLEMMEPDLIYIQELLGHASSRTTEIYTQVSYQGVQKIKNPIDDIL